ncbi:TonB-dependent receptor [Croceivirga thetidis]|uniref:Plug domain-containing protein n=1 Tax=Croceivirga thetidis TaxID=2721623 RepID=A0ABX1GMP8_9FLAO|nr:Plug domain-containing protein [Croceivirga thetidis]NKI30918.1 Plug domain-containing protein [Croceivirga thetidis]
MNHLTKQAMNKTLCLLLLVALSLGTSCTSSKSSTAATAEEIEEKNQGHIPLLTRIRRLPGVVLQNGVPTIAKNTNTVSTFGSGEPLYILDGQLIGNSFNRINDLVDNFNVKSVKVLKGSAASSYGAQAASGVIAIETYQ